MLVTILQIEDIELSIVAPDIEDNHISSDINTIVIIRKNQVEVETKPDINGQFLNLSNAEEDVQVIQIQSKCQILKKIVKM